MCHSTPIRRGRKPSQLSTLAGLYRLHVFFNLLQTARAHILAAVIASVPLHRVRQRLVQTPPRSPAQPRDGLRRIQPQQVRLVNLRRLVGIPSAAARRPKALPAPSPDSAPDAHPRRPAQSSSPRQTPRHPRTAARPAADIPHSGSSTCCHGRTASGLRITTASPAAHARIMSGTSRSGAQSPPPITFPARAEATPTRCSAHLSG